MSNNTQRYEVVAEYPKCTVGKGQILNAETPEEKAWCDKYPHLFRLLKWWEHVPIDELPKYVKWVDVNYAECLKVDKWVLEKPDEDDIEGILFIGDNHYSSGFIYDYVGEIYPATEAEYNDYLTKLN